MNQPRSRRLGRKSLRFESLESRQLLSATPTISIGDATAIEGSDQLKVLDQFIASGSGGLTRPRVSVFGPDSTGDGVNELYVASADTDEILRYDGDTGAFLDAFVSQGSGGLDAPLDLEFAPDGSLYISTHVNQSPEISKVLRYDGFTGAFLEEIASGLNGAHGISWHDGALYVTTHYGSEVFKYDSSGFNVFVPAGSGGLNGARHALFGHDANGDAREDLYVASQNTKQVLRYDGQTGAFIDVFVTTDNLATWIEFGPDGDLYVGGVESGGSTSNITRIDTETREILDVFSIGQAGWPVTADAQGILYNSNIIDRSVYRYGASSLAAFTVSLSAPSATPMTVNFATQNGSAIAGSDFDGTSGTLTFAPGQTSRTILIPTVNDATIELNESFSVVLSNATGGVIADNTGVGTIIDDDTKFYVVNDGTTAAADKTYEYGSGLGAAGENYALNGVNTVPRGAASTAAGDKVWVVDANRTVYVYGSGGNLLGSWSAGSIPGSSDVQGITTNGIDVWIVDAKSDKVYRYANAASRLSGSQNAASNFVVNKNNANPKDLVTDGTHIWVVDDGTADKVFKYTLSGSLVGSWTITTSGATSPTGITLDPASPSDLWIVDNGTDRVYQYSGGVAWTSGNRPTSISFALAPGNTNPQGIADPPSSVAEAAVSTPTSFAAAFPSSTSVPSRSYTPSRRPTLSAATQAQTFNDLNLLPRTNLADRQMVLETKPCASINSVDRTFLDAAFASLDSDRWSELAADTLAI